MTEPALTRETLRAIVQAKGLAPSEADLDGLLPLVQALRTMLDELSPLPLEDVEPTTLYHML